MKTGVFGQFFLGTGRVPGWSPTPPLASCHRDTNRAVLGPVLNQFLGQFWALPGRPGAAREAQNRTKNCPKLKVCYKTSNNVKNWIFLNWESLVPEVPRTVGLPPAPGEARGHQIRSFFAFFWILFGPFFWPL